MLSFSTIQLLRFHFSLFLLPVFLFALSQAETIRLVPALLAGFILHLLVYPASNGYNSYMDRDTTPIGGVEKPLQPTQQLFVVTILMDIVALLLSLFISVLFALCVLIYILASRAYSYRGIRLKKYPITGYLLVVICQGALVFLMCWHAAGGGELSDAPVLPMVVASMLIGGYYPLTQVYQHEADRQDGVKTISMLLGKRGSFIFSGLMFAGATLVLYFSLTEEQRKLEFLVFAACMLPVVWFFCLWSRRVWRDENSANFRSSLNMNLLAALCTTVCFSLFIIIRHS